MKTHTSADGRTAHLTFALPATLIDEIADAVAERLGAGDLVLARSPWLDVQGAADYLGMTADAVRKAAQRGLLPAHQPFGKGSRYFFHYRELDEYLLAAAISGVEVAGVDTANGSRT
jgi:excisionase family DNA binding protein